MSIPPLQINGILPIGEYHATIAEILGAFPRRSIERQELNQALQDAIPTFIHLKSLAPDITIYIDGSYTTSKVSPNDIDILILTDVFDEVQIQEFFDQECPIAATYFDLHADPARRSNLLHVFTRTRNGTPKGILILDI